MTGLLINNQTNENKTQIIQQYLLKKLSEKQFTEICYSTSDIC